FNNDGTDDLVYVDYLSNQVFLALNDGANFFLRVTFQETGGFQPVAARVGDFNDDDNLDVMVVNRGNASGSTGTQSIVTLLLGDGTGRLAPTNALLQVPNFAVSLVGGTTNFETKDLSRIVDLNNDGYPDVLVASTRGGLPAIGSDVPTVTLLMNRPD